MTRVTLKFRSISRPSCAKTTFTNLIKMLLFAIWKQSKQNGTIASSFMALCQEYCRKFKVPKIFNFVKVIYMSKSAPELSTQTTYNAKMCDIQVIWTMDWRYIHEFAHRNNFKILDMMCRLVWNGCEGFKKATILAYCICRPNYLKNLNTECW